MQAVSITPLETDSVDLTEVPEPPETDGPVLVKTLAVGVCGTDLESSRATTAGRPRAGPASPSAMSRSARCSKRPDRLGC